MEFGETRDFIGVETEGRAVEDGAEAAGEESARIESAARTSARDDRNALRRLRGEFGEFFQRFRRGAVDVVERDFARRERRERGQQRVERRRDVGDVERAREALAKGFERFVVFEREVRGRVCACAEIRRDGRAYRSVIGRMNVSWP